MESSEPIPNPFLQQLQSWVGRTTQEAEGVPTPTGVWLNGRLLQVARGALTFEYTVRPEMGNPVGLLHGGMLATMIDDCMGATLFSYTHERFYATVNLHIDYLASARIGDRVQVSAEVVRAGRNIAYVRAEARNAEGKLLATASSNLLATQTLTA